MSDNNQSVAALQQQVVKSNSPINRVCVEGLVGDDPRYIRGDDRKTAFATFSIAINETYKKAGELKVKTTWVSIVCYGAMADTANLCVTKGKRLIVEGKLSTSTWEDKKTGEKRSSLQVKAGCLRFLDKKHEKAEDIANDPIAAEA